MDVNWDGITRAESLSDEVVQRRGALADAAKRYDWAVVLALLAKNPDWINATRLGGTSLYTPLHQAAHGGAPADIVGRLIGLGALRTIRNARGERPVDVATRRGHQHLIDVLAPQLKHRVPLDALLAARERMVREIQRGLDDGERRFLLSLAAGTPAWSLLGIAHLEHLPGIRWKLHNLAQLQKTDAKKFSEQADLLATRLATVS